MAEWGAQALAVSHWTVVGDAASEQDGAEGSRLKSRSPCRKIRRGNGILCGATRKPFSTGICFESAVRYTLDKIL